MEDDDEFGDLYTDVLQPFASSSSPPIPNPPPLPPPAAPDSPVTYKQPQSPQHRQIPQFADSSPPDLNPTNEPDADSMPNDVEVKFDIEDDEVDGIGSEPVIPGLSGGDAPAEAPGRIEERGDGGGDDWDDSDSEDDLQIVLNDNSMMAMERDGMMADGCGDGDEDDGLNIVAGGEANVGVEEQEWGESTVQMVDGERKDVAELGKGSGGVTVAPKIGYGPQGYHPPFHSHFKYVRPGAAPMPGTTAAPGGLPGQIRPLANMNPMAGRGRGDWRPPGIKGAAAMQKGFHAGPGLPWGNNATGRGGGLEFTLPSHKTIFDVDIDSFEEKPWKYPGVDVSVFFNFDLNEDSWKDYCKQLEQLRLESTMQSKIRVYESGRTEQEFDPDLPPELAAATGVHDAPVENTNSVKPDVGQSDLMNGSGPLRPPIPTGRAIQVEGGYGERLPSIDTRPPRLRDSDAIIEIVLQDTEDDDSAEGIDAEDQPVGGELQREDSREHNVVEDEIPRVEPAYFAGFPKDHNDRKRELVGRRVPLMSSNTASLPDEDERPFPQEEPSDYSDSRRQTHRQMQGRAHGLSRHSTPRREMTIVDNKKEESVASMENRHSSHLSPPVSKDAKESSVENKDPELEETGTAGGSSGLQKEGIDIDTEDSRDTPNDEVAETHKLTSRTEQPLLEEGDDWEDSKAARSSDNSKAISASSREYQKHGEGFEDEVAQDPRSMHQGSIRRQSVENGQVFDTRDHGGRQEPDRNHVVVKGREDAWMRRDDDPYSRRGRNDELRKRGRSKVRENERSDKDDSVHSRKQLDNGGYRVAYDKDVGSRVSRHRERDDGLKGRHEAVEDFHSKKRKDEEYLRREHIYKEEVLHGYRENASRHRRERDDVLDLRKRDGHQRSRDNVDDQYAARQKDEAWLLRERGDRQRDREDWHRREREEGRSSVRSGRGVEEKTWVGHVKAKDEHKVPEKEYQSVEAMRHSDQLKRRDRIVGESQHHRGRDDAYARDRGIQYSSEEKRPRQEKSSRHSDRVANASDNHRVHERKHKEGSRKSKEPVVGSFSSLGMSNRSQEDQSGQINEKGSKGSGDEEHIEHEIPGHRLSRKHQDDVFSDNEQQDSQRGRSKLERWTSPKERDFSISNKSSSSLKFKDLGKDNIDGSSDAGKPVDESAKIVDTDNQGLLLAEGKDYVDTESKDADTKGLGDRHLDTVERLKKRSERFKLPMPIPSEKESVVIKKIESESLPPPPPLPLPSAKSENPVELEVKQERPARKRRWISN